MAYPTTCPKCRGTKCYDTSQGGWACRNCKYAVNKTGQELNPVTGEVAKASGLAKAAKAKAKADAAEPAQSGLTFPGAKASSPPSDSED